MTQQVIVDTLIDENGNEVHLYMDVEPVKRCGTCGEEKSISHFTNGECNDCYFAELGEDDDLTLDDITAIDEAMSQPDSRPYTAEELAAMVEEAEGSAGLSQEARLILFLEGASTMKIYDESLYCQECGKKINVQEDKFFNGHCEDCYTGNVDVSDEAQDALQRAWDELQGVPSLVEEETHQIALQTEMQARDDVCSEAFSAFLNAELERTLQMALNSSCWDNESAAIQERLLAINAIREQEDRETAEFYRVMAEAQ